MQVKLPDVCKVTSKCNTKTRGVSHSVALPFYIQNYLKAKEELWKFKYSTMQKYNPQKNPLSNKPKSFKISSLCN
jgi:hypothetical protein